MISAMSTAAPSPAEPPDSASSAAPVTPPRPQLSPDDPFHDPALAVVVEPMLGVTLAPTKVRASEKINVIPARAQVQRAGAQRPHEEREPGRHAAASATGPSIRR